MSAVPVEVLVEELSAELALRVLLPKIIPGVAFEIRRFQGKPALLKKLPQRLAGYAAWPVPPSVVKKSGLRDPDAIRGGTAEAFGRLLQRHGYHEAGPAKATAAADIAVHMNIHDNASRSFQVFRDGVRELVETGSA